MRYVIGLGNPGAKYTHNRHNAGHLFIDFLQNELKQSNAHKLRNAVVLKKTDGYMNQSGIFVKKVVDSSKIELPKLFIVHDDLDIPLGKFKIQYGTGPKLHNGIRSIEDSLGSNYFWRIRIGVDNRTPAQPDGSKKWIDGETYSLEDFTSEEEERLQSTFQLIYKQLGRFAE